VQTANSGDVALEKVRTLLESSSCCKTFWLILMDIDMPVKDGYQTTKEI
jgi:CheY-like chemotaxis protein